ncbi:MAG TPA: peptidylprolyl isomerase [Candidatus Omnitrophota bacterium]|nr:peptidylprolyl isomerase [Candidatus Omnitrophota bacterium]
MIKKIIPLLCIFSALIVSGIHADVIDKIAVIVNNEAVTLGEIDQMLLPVYARYKAAYKDQRELVKKMEEARQKIVEQLIEDKLILSEAKRLNIEIDEKEVEARIRQVEKQFASKNAFTRALMEQHLSVKELKNKYREQMMVKKIIDSKIGSRVIITPVEVHAYYNSHISDFTQPAEAKIRNILIKIKDESDIQRAAGLAKEIEDKLKAGEDFASLAQSYSEGPAASEGGLMGTIRKGDMMPELEASIFSLKEGDISGIVQSPLGYHIFKIEEMKPQRTLSDSEAYKEIEELLFRDKIKQKIKGWVDSLRKNAYIAFK